MRFCFWRDLRPPIWHIKSVCAEKQLVLKQFLRSEKLGVAKCGGLVYSGQMDIEDVFSCGYYDTMRCHQRN